MPAFEDPPDRILFYQNPLNYRNTVEIDDYRACSRIFTAETKAQVWDADLPGAQDKVLDDVALRKRLALYVRDVRPSELRW